MRDPELVARAQRAVARLESAWERLAEFLERAAAVIMTPPTWALSPCTGTFLGSRRRGTSRLRRPRIQTSSPLRASYRVPSVGTASYQEGVPD